MARVLVVDDERDIVYLLRKILVKEGYEVLEAYGGEEALQIVNKERPDVVLLDVMMHDINGWEVSRIIKSNEETRDIPIIVYSVRTCENSIRKSMLYGCANAHIGKPASGSEILGKINSVLT